MQPVWCVRLDELCGRTIAAVDLTDRVLTLTFTDGVQAQFVMVDDREFVAVWPSLALWTPECDTYG
jgi:hypothetical protein